MSQTLDKIRALVEAGEILISEHGYDELTADDLTVRDVVMNMKRRSKLIHEGSYVAEVDIELIEMDEGWSPLLSLEDAQRLDDVRDALRHGDVERAASLARVYTLTPVNV